MKSVVWKVLIYDRNGQDIISPLFTVSELREYGVTLHLQLESVRDKIPESTAIYFLHPTEENIKRICNDMKESLYSKYYLSFIRPISRILLEFLADKTVEYNCQSQLCKIYDEYLNFVTLNEDLFISRNYNREQISFEQLNSKFLTAEEIHHRITEIVDSLFSFICTLGIVPIIKYSKGSASELVAKELHRRICDHLLETKGAGISRFSSSRPFLFLYDRYNDLIPPLLHSWSYISLIDDFFVMSIMFPDSTSQHLYDLYSFDKFFQDHRFKPFPEVAGDIQTEIKNYKECESSIKNLNSNPDDEIIDDIWSSNTSKLTSAMNSLPELLKRKTFLNMHTNIASSIMDTIKSNKIDSLYEIEEKILSKTLKDTNEIMKLLNDENIESLDKIRLFLISYINDLFTHSDLEKIKTIGLVNSALEFVYQYKNFTTMTPKPSPLHSRASSYSSVLSRFVANTPSILMQGVKNLVLNDNVQMLLIVNLGACFDAYNTEQSDFLTLDSRLNGDSHMGPKNIPPNEIIVYVVGGGCYSEYQDLMSLL
ncbi:hypothetical protein HZS_3663, partial [Henneguya salminicola]